MPYCTIEQARNAGATGTDAEVTTAIAEASEMIDEYCNEWFDPRAAQTIVAEFGANGVAVLARRVRAITSVTYVGSTSALAASSYRMRTSATVGDIDAVEMLGAGAGSDILVAGAEPWNGGWSNLSAPGRRISVVGDFGYAAVPAAVTRACAILAAFFSNNPGGGGESTAGVKSLSVEGYRVEYSDEATAMTTTGVLEVDRLLAPFRRGKVGIR